jgi:hypothetical protein
VKEHEGTETKSLNAIANGVPEASELQPPEKCNKRFDFVYVQTKLRDHNAMGSSNPNVKPIFCFSLREFSFLFFFWEILT